MMINLAFTYLMIYYLALDAAVGSVVFERVTKRIRARKVAAVFVTNVKIKKLFTVNIE